MKIPVNAVMDKWRDGITEKHAFEHYDTYIKKYCGATSPIVGGQNVRGYDLIIYNRCCNKYGIPYRFYRREELDLLDYFSHWFMFAKTPPKNYKLDTIRAKFGMSLEGAHDALVDVYDTAKILLRFLKLHQTIVPKIKELYE
jgi:DNA polymerase III epsilon subunit-like protein